MSDISSINSKTLDFFPILNKSLHSSDDNADNLNVLVQQLSQLGIGSSVYESVILEIQSYFNYNIVPKFWKSIQLPRHNDQDGFKNIYQNKANREASETTNKSQLHYSIVKTFFLAVQQLYNDYNEMKKMMQFVDLLKTEILTNSSNTSIVHTSINEIMQTALLSQLPVSFNLFVHDFYEVSFKVFVKMHIESDKDVDEPEFNELICNGCEMEVKLCQCQELMNIFNEINRILKEMDLLDRIAGQSLTALIKKHISSHVRNHCQGIFNRNHLQLLKQWLDDIVLNWLTRIYNCGNLDDGKSATAPSSVIEDFKIKLTYFLYETYSNILIKQFFNIIIDYPDSIPAIDDLKMCLEMIDLRKPLINNIKESLESRILHAGVNTMDILTAYVAAIKAIRYLDNSGIILESVMDPIKKYLRNRTDTVRKVVTELTEDGPTDLAEELAKGDTYKENEYASGTEDINNWENWNPDPIESEISSLPIVKNNRSADIISMVVNIYGSKDLFVNEYRNLLADRLLSQLDFSCEKEIRNMELLKLRFGETLLHSCEIMLKDISDSKRINAHIQSDNNYQSERQFDLSSLIVSSQFWPAFNKESLELPKEIENEFKMYTKSYEAYKGNRTLNWRYVTGRVLIEVELADRVLEMTVPPTQAVILYYFQFKNEWSLEELSNLIKIPASLLRRKLIFWQTHGVIKESKTDFYEIIEELDHKSNTQKLPVTEMVDDETETAMASASDQRQEELQVFWSYIVGMLTNLDSLSIERIHQMLKLFAGHGPGIEFTREELKNFLQTKVREHKLIFSGGVYQLAK